MKALIVLICIGVIAFFAVMYAIEYMKLDSAKVRVEQIFGGLHDGPFQPTTDVQRAISQWYEGTALIMDRNTLQHASDLFDAWLKKKNLYKKITSFEVTDTTLLKGSAPETVLVTCTIEGETYQLEVAKGVQVTWVN